MRVIAGTLGGRQIHEPHGHRTHPMSEKIRGALFNALGDIEGLTVLDAFAGSGALAIEAISRGARSAVAIDIDRRAHDALSQNITELGLIGKVKAIKANASGWSDNNPRAKFDLVLAAPPYDNLQLSLLQKLTHHTKTGGLFVLDWPGKTLIPEFEGFELVSDKNYADAQLAFYRKK